jgi:hypothetical protein
MTNSAYSHDANYHHKHLRHYRQARWQRIANVALAFRLRAFHRAGLACILPWPSHLDAVHPNTERWQADSLDGEILLLFDSWSVSHY